MFGTQIVVRRGGRDEAEKPFWISFADLMTALMVLFLVVMGVALLAVTKNVTEKEKREEQHRKDIELILDRFQATAKRYNGIKIDRDRHVIDFGDRARFAFGKSNLAPEQEAVLRQFVPEILTLANGDLGKRILKRVVVEGYLHDRNREIRDSRPGPAWVDTAIENRQLFNEAPCTPYVSQLLRGDESHIDRICEQLQIGKESWFLRQLVLTQVEGATKLGDDEFVSLLPRLLGLLARNEVLRDRGTILVLDRYARVSGSPLHPRLRDHAVTWWGNPWLPSNATRWGGVAPAARTMVSDWLKLEFIETFFTKLAEDGLADRRRMEFWKRYVKSIDDIEFALGSTARNSREPDLVALRKKMKGLTRELDASGANNAFIMTMGKLVAVEFSGLGNAFYGYDASRSLPFNTSQTLKLGKDERNSLKRSNRMLWLKHGDGIHGWNRWEDMFEATLRESFQIVPSVDTSRASVRTQAANERAKPTSFTPQRENARSSQNRTQTHESYSHVALKRFAATHGLQIDDRTAVGGNLWVRGDEDDGHIGQVLADWGFHAKPGKGWWK
ncbi:EH signature domain-containing protein [Paraburkholderia sp. BR14374]|uniref:EH signature domain-containing protein n=1 Tax=Paraburkholderia sp. BR14374 TaxID=3237007 RepID=UPI0034CEFAA6